jgi:hypothetical protein
MERTGRRCALWSLTLLLASPAAAQLCQSFGNGIFVGFDTVDGMESREANCACGFTCEEGLRCYPPILTDAIYETLPLGCNPKTQACTVRATVPVTFPGNSQGLGTPGSGAYLDWTGLTAVAVASCGYFGQQIFADRGNAWIQVSGFTCASGAATATYELLAQVCIAGCPQPASQRQSTRMVDLSRPNLEAMFCKKPPAGGCPEQSPAGACCLGPAGGSSPSGGGAGTGGDGTGPDAYLYYLAGGVGHPDFPGAVLWQPTLGRYWSHTWAERIVLDPNDSHVWLISMYGTYVEFSGLSGGVYATTRPSDDHRKLRRTATGWELRSLDGTVSNPSTPPVAGAAPWTATATPRSPTTTPAP